MKLRYPLLAAAVISPSLAGPYPPAAGGPGTDAVAKDDPRILQWASGHLDYAPAPEVAATWRTPLKAYGAATGDPFDIASLGDGGRITLYFPHPIADGEGADFAVFENSFSDTFLELAFVEVSSDGANFFRFPSASLTPGPVGGFGGVDPTDLDGLAGKYRAGFGTPFDLALLPSSPALDKRRVRFVRLVDVKGDGSAKDGSGRPIYDPYPTIGSAGFDLEAIGVIHRDTGGFAITAAAPAGEGFSLTWQSNPGSSYRIETAADLADWSLVETVAGTPDLATTTRIVPRSSDPRRFWRIVRVGG